MGNCSAQGCENSCSPDEFNYGTQMVHEHKKKVVHPCSSKKELTALLNSTDKLALETEEIHTAEHTPQPADNQLKFGKKDEKHQVRATTKSNLVYEGEMKNHMRNGFGVQTWPDGSRFEGLWKDDQAEGNGRLVDKNGNWYEGEFCANKAIGYGKLWLMNGYMYAGNWEDDMQEGEGEEHQADGHSYKGTFAKGRKHGRGLYTWEDRSRYEGEWVGDLIEGRVCCSSIYCRQTLKFSQNREHFTGLMASITRVNGAITR
eukprot:TRINITY_DN3537_c0_g1_i3.p1 TRINITY_DN3537_c0_g1~~TRINITY_DN3537_c0_g1_i3.p1  ORF type:complete len:259 (-),score=22.81 TRINITY_DN3537_c0_g1_i3:467-1243(-)